MSGMGFTQLMDIVSQNTKLVGMDIDAMKKELQLIKLIQLQLMENQKNAVQALRAHNINIEFKSLFDIQKEAAAEPTSSPVEHDTKG